MHHSAICVNAPYVGFEVSGVSANIACPSGDTPPDLCMNGARCV
jgi:hypothetical protein